MQNSQLVAANSKWQEKHMMYSLKEAKPLKPVLTVSELTGQVKESLETDFRSVLVAGEVSNFKSYPSGHWYFSLKDQDATLPCVCFKGANQYIRFALEDGLSVIARGKLSVYPKRGAYQMIVAGMEPVGIGEWQLAFEQLKSKLDAEGALDRPRRPIPIMPSRVGIVTSPAGAAVQDIIDTLRRRNKNVRATIAPAIVQGDSSAESIVEALALLSRVDDLDVIIVARGGGSIEDLWSFNTETVARAVIECPVPVISGVGHETDITICDLVADLRAPTPTAAAELVARGQEELAEQWSALSRSLGMLIRAHLDTNRNRLERLSPRESLLRYSDRLNGNLQSVQYLKSTVTRSVEARLTSFQHRLDRASEQLAALSPENVIKRGFTILRKADGSRQLVRSVDDVGKGDILEAITGDGRLILEVKERPVKRAIRESLI